MTDKNQDPNLQAPQEANTTKHINFLDSESDGGSSDSDDNDASGKSATKKAWEELRRDQQENTGSKD